MSFRIKCVITIKACQRTWMSGSCSKSKMSFTRSFSWLGKRVNMSANVTMIFAFTPNSICDFTILNSKSKCLAQIYDETQQILERARIADLSMMQRVGAQSTASLSEYLVKASSATVKIIGKNLPINPFYTISFSLSSMSLYVYYSTSASLPPVIYARSSSYFLPPSGF